MGNFKQLSTFYCVNFKACVCDIRVTTGMDFFPFHSAVVDPSIEEYPGTDDLSHESISTACYGVT